MFATMLVVRVQGTHICTRKPYSMHVRTRTGIEFVRAFRRDGRVSIRHAYLPFFDCDVVAPTLATFRSLLFPSGDPSAGLVPLIREGDELDKETIPPGSTG